MNFRNDSDFSAIPYKAMHDKSICLRRDPDLPDSYLTKYLLCSIDTKKPKQLTSDRMGRRVIVTPKERIPSQGNKIYDPRESDFSKEMQSYSRSFISKLLTSAKISIGTAGAK